MKLLRKTHHLALLDKGAVATIGTFDGVHLGHQHLLHFLKAKATQMQVPLVVILFEPQPREYFLGGEAPARLSSLREKLDRLGRLGVDYVYCIKFDTTLAQTPAVDFIHNYLFSLLKVQYLMVGHDFRFGQGREGDIELLKILGSRYSCQVESCPDFVLEHEKVSSTRVRKALREGDLHDAARLLGGTYSLCGRVVRGDGRGRQWGIPTANLLVQRRSLPLLGVFVVYVPIASKKVYGVANMGKRPTVDGTKNVLEVHLFDFDASLYGTWMQVFFLHKLRDEVKFTSVDALITQIHQDIADAKTYIAQNHD